MGLPMKTLTIGGVTYDITDPDARTAAGTVFADGETFQEKYDSGALTGPQGEQGEQGPAGADGKSAYAYAQDGGYAGTEEEFADKLAAPSGGGSGKRVARFTVGTSTNGWTADDVDYLCDGTNDAAQINAAIQALPSNGGEIVILDGTYTLEAAVLVNKDGVALTGNGTATKLVRAFEYTSTEYSGMVTVAGNHCLVEKLFLGGTVGAYASNDYICGILVTGSHNIVSNNRLEGDGSGIGVMAGEENVVTGNYCDSYGGGHGCIFENSERISIIGNSCFNSGVACINSVGASAIVSGNVCVSGKVGIRRHSVTDCSASITGNYVEGATVTGIKVAKYSVVSGNEIRTPSIGVHVYGDRCTISANAIHELTVSGVMTDDAITIDDAYGCIVSGNNISGHMDAVLLTNSSGTIIIGNHCKGAVSGKIILSGDGNDDNLICNNIFGGYTTDGGTNNTFVDNKEV